MNYSKYTNNANQMRYSTHNVSYNQVQQPSQNISPIYYVSNIPIDLAKSLEGKYFLGVAEDLEFGNATSAWARLYNPPDSGVNLFVNVWTVSDIVSSPFKVQIWLNSNPNGFIQQSPLITPANTAINPLPQSKVKLEYAIGVKGFPEGGAKTYGRIGPAGVTITSEENGKIIIPPGGSFLVYVSNPERPTQLATSKIAFGWWEEPIQQ